MISLIDRNKLLVALSFETIPEKYANGQQLLLMDTAEEKIYSEGTKEWLTTKTGAKTFSQFAIDTPPTKVTYVEGDKLDLTGLKIVAQYNDDSEMDVTGLAKSDIGDRPLTTSDTKIVFSIGEETVEQAITVAALAVESIAITNPPTKTEYVEGEKLDMTGLEVTATYNNGDTKIVTGDCAFSPTLETALTQEDVSVTITYSGKTATQEITVTAENIEE